MKTDTNLANHIPYQAPAHAFNPMYAARYGLEEAIIIAHFQHWVNHNKRLDYNRIENRTWTYQTRKQIAAHFPYFTEKQVRRITDSLESQGVIIKGIFNKKGFDKTIWYAFKNEELFTIAQMGNSSAQMGNACAQMGTPIPYTKPNTRKKKNIVETPEEKSPAAAAGCRRASFLLEKIRLMDPKFRPPNLEKWEDDIDKIIRIDGRSNDEVKEVIDWVFDNEFWKQNILSGAKLRVQFSKLYIAMTAQKNSPQEKKKSEEKARKHRIDKNKSSSRIFLSDKNFKNIHNMLTLREGGVEVKLNGRWKTLSYAEHGFEEQLNNAYRKIEANAAYR